MSWPTVALHEVAEIERDSVKPENIISGTRYLGLEHIESGGRIINFETVENGELASSKFNFGPRHILYGKLRPYLAKIALPDFDGVCSTDILPVMPSERIERNYLAHFLRQSSMVDYANNLSAGANLPRLSPKALAEFPIPLPLLDEQKRIAGILDQADALRRLRLRALDKLNTLGQAIFHEMFGDPAIEPYRWPSKPLTEFVANKDDIRCGPFGTQLHKSEFQASGVPLWGIKQVNKHFDIETEEFVSEEKFNDLRVYSLETDDIVMTRKGTIGNCAVYPSDFPVGVMHSDLLRLRVDRERHNPTFVSAQLRFNRSFGHQLKLISGGAIMAGINVSRLKLLEAIAPPKELQDQYERRLTVLEGNRQELIRAVDGQSSLFASLQHRAFRGEL